MIRSSDNTPDHLGKQEATVTIPANGHARADFSFTAK